MKKSLSILLGLAIFSSCNRENTEAPENTISLSAKTSIQKNEVAEISIKNLPAGNIYARWTVVPSDGVVIEKKYTGSGTSRITFAQPGQYRVSADLREVHRNCIPTSDFDTCYTLKTSLGVPYITVNVTN